MPRTSGGIAAATCNAMRHVAAILLIAAACGDSAPSADAPSAADAPPPPTCQVASGPWYEPPPAPLRERFASPTGGGDGTTVDAPLALTDAIASAAPGDLVWLLGGEYAGELELAADGTAGAPIVYRALPGQHALVRGGVRARGAHTWVWGLDITDPTGTTAGSILALEAPHVRAINNVLHAGTPLRTGLSAFRTGPGHVIYGNVIFDSHHNIYTQNSAEADGTKYFVANVSLDALPRADGTNGPFELHAYTEGGEISGFHLEENVFANVADPEGGRALLGGYNLPADRQVIDRNVFYRVSAQLGYRRPAQARFTNNVMFDAPIVAGRFWGAGETEYAQTAPNVVTDNEIHLGARGITLVTSAYVAVGTCGCTATPCQALGCPALQATDEWDRNTYSGFRASLDAGGVATGGASLATWRAATAAAGNAFDQTSTEVAPPTGTWVRLIPNAYAPARALAVVVNHDDSAGVATIDLAGRAGRRVRASRDPRSVRSARRDRRVHGSAVLDRRAGLAPDLPHQSHDRGLQRRLKQEWYIGPFQCRM